MSPRSTLKPYLSYWYLYLVFCIIALEKSFIKLKRYKYNYRQIRVYRSNKKYQRKNFSLAGISSEAMRRRVEPLKAVKRNLKFRRTGKGKVRRANLLSSRESGLKPIGIREIGFFSKLILYIWLKSRFELFPKVSYETLRP